MEHFKYASGYGKYVTDHLGSIVFNIIGLYNSLLMLTLSNKAIDNFKYLSAIAKELVYANDTPLTVITSLMPV